MHSNHNPKLDSSTVELLESTIELLDVVVNQLVAPSAIQVLRIELMLGLDIAKYSNTLNPLLKTAERISDLVSEARRRDLSAEVHLFCPPRIDEKLSERLISNNEDVFSLEGVRLQPSSKSISKGLA